MGIKSLSDFLLTLSTGLFTGIATHTVLIESPTRNHDLLDDRAKLQHWRSSFIRAARIQSTLAMFSACVAIPLSVYRKDVIQLASGVVMILVIPYTYIWIMPVSEKLYDAGVGSGGTAEGAAEPGTTECTELLERWSRLQAGRTVMGWCAFVLAAGQLI